MRSYEGDSKDLPDIFLAIPPSGFELFKMLGDTISFDITYNLLKTRTVLKRQWGLGIFTGVGFNLEIVVFGFCLTSL